MFKSKNVYLKRLKVLSLLEALQTEMEKVKGLVQNLELNDKSGKSIDYDSFKRLQEKVKKQGDFMMNLKVQVKAKEK